MIWPRAYNLKTVPTLQCISGFKDGAKQMSQSYSLVSFHEYQHIISRLILSMWMKARSSKQQRSTMKVIQHLTRDPQCLFVSLPFLQCVFLCSCLESYKTSKVSTNRSSSLPQNIALLKRLLCLLAFALFDITLRHNVTHLHHTSG